MIKHIFSQICLKVVDKQLSLNTVRTYMKVYIWHFSVAGGMDFRAMLMRKKKPAKKVVVVSTHAHILPLLSSHELGEQG